jgi:hypothetical protein
MITEETALVLDRLATAFRVEVPPEALEVWSDQLEGVAADVALDACENIIGIETYFPTVAIFKKEVSAVLRHRAREEALATSRGEGRAKADCGFCGGLRWYESAPLQIADQATGEIKVYEQWKPCPHCSPVEYRRWEEHNAEREAVERHRREDAGEFDLARVLAEAKRRLTETQPDERAEAQRAHEARRPH